MRTAYGGMYIAAGAATQALSTSAAALAQWSASGGANGIYSQGDPAVIPDYANNRVKVNSPGRYKVTVQLSVDSDAAFDLTMRLRKNGTAVTGAACQQRVTTDLNQIVGVFFVEVLATDSPDTLVTFADPSSSGFGGAGGAPKTLSYLDVSLAANTGTPTLTFQECQFLVERLDD